MKRKRTRKFENINRQRMVLMFHSREDFSTTLIHPYLRGCAHKQKTPYNVHPMTKYFWCSDAELGHRLARFNCVPSEQQDRGSLSTASQQAALLGSQHRKISPEGRKLSNRLQSSQEVGDVLKDKVTPHRGGLLMVWAFRYTSYGLMFLYTPFSLFVGLYFCQSEDFKFFIPAVSIEYIRTPFWQPSQHRLTS